SNCDKLNLHCVSPFELLPSQSLYDEADGLWSRARIVLTPPTKAEIPGCAATNPTTAACTVGDCITAVTTPTKPSRYFVTVFIGCFSFFICEESNRLQSAQAIPAE